MKEILLQIYTISNIQKSNCYYIITIAMYGDYNYIIKYIKN